MLHFVKYTHTHTYICTLYIYTYTYVLASKDTFAKYVSTFIVNPRMEKSESN